MEGLVSFPSFHVAGAVMVTWALRQSRVWMAILLPINLLLTVATVLTGVHYVADLFGTAAMCAISLWLYRRFAVRWLERGNTPVHSRETVPPDYGVGADGVSQLEGTR
jgi:membrane-associated phospholipid phosphatase